VYVSFVKIDNGEAVTCSRKVSSATGAIHGFTSNRLYDKKHPPGMFVKQHMQFATRNVNNNNNDPWLERVSTLHATLLSSALLT
jgi:hypothetical protein